jgi:hypothetical protein
LFKTKSIVFIACFKGERQKAVNLILLPGFELHQSGFIFFCVNFPFNLSNWLFEKRLDPEDGIETPIVGSQT